MGCKAFTIKRDMYLSIFLNYLHLRYAQKCDWKKDVAI